MGFFSKKRGSRPHAGHNAPFNVRMMERASGVPEITIWLDYKHEDAKEIRI